MIFIVQEDMAAAFGNEKWTLVPEFEHLDYLLQLWRDNLRRAPDQRERYIPVGNFLCPSVRSSDVWLSQTRI